MESGSNIQSFLDIFLKSPASSIPKGAQWAVGFNETELRKILETIDKAYELEPQAKLWNTSSAANIVLRDEYQKLRGCLFAQAIQLPGERTQTNAEGNIQSNALIRSRVGAGREDFGTLKMTFLETNISFVDSFLRGWSLATANFGLIARNDDKQYRTNMFCYKFGTSPQGLTILQKIIFEGICCVSVTSEEYNYAPLQGQAVMREAEFVYNSYSIDSASNLSEELRANNPPFVPSPDLISSVPRTA